MPIIIPIISSGFLVIITELFGGWTSGLSTLCYFMLLDIILGIATATLSKNSTKSNSGKLQSRALYKGILKKVGILTVVVICHRLDIEVQQYIPTFSSIELFTVWFFIIDETISIVENLGLLGVKIPKKILNVIEVLQDRLEELSTGDILANKNKQNFNIDNISEDTKSEFEDQKEGGVDNDKSQR